MKKNDIEKAKSSCVNYYDKNYEVYYQKYSDELAQKQYDKDFLKRFISGIENNGRILDVGCCSTAQQARFFRDNKYRVTSIDISGKCIEKAKQNFTGIDFYTMDMTKMRFDNESFDAINAFYSIIHIPDEQLNELFKSFHRILKSGGKLALVVHEGNFYGYYKENEFDVFYRAFTMEELVKHLIKSGFIIVEMSRRLPLDELEVQSERIYIIARKQGL